MPFRVLLAGLASFKAKCAIMVFRYAERSLAERAATKARLCSLANFGQRCALRAPTFLEKDAFRLQAKISSKLCCTMRTDVTSRQGILVKYCAKWVFRKAGTGAAVGSQSVGKVGRWRPGVNAGSKAPEAKYGLPDQYVLYLAHHAAENYQGGFLILRYKKEHGGDIVSQRWAVMGARHQTLDSTSSSRDTFRRGEDLGSSAMRR